MKRSKLKTRLLTLLMATVLLVNNNATVLAANDKYLPTTPGNVDIGNGSCNGGDGSGGAHMLQLVSVKNSVTGDKEKERKAEYQNKDGVYVGDINATIINTYRNFVDTTTMFNISVMENAAFMPRAGWNNRTPSRLNLNVDSSGGGISIYCPNGSPFRVIRNAQRKEGWWELKENWGAYSDLMMGTYQPAILDWNDRSEEMAQKYIDHVFGPGGSLLWNNANSIRENIYGAYLNQQSKIASDFISYTTPQSSSLRGDRGAGYTLAYYTAVVLESEFQRNNNYIDKNYTETNEEGRELLKKYWMNRNDNGAEEFVVIADLAVAGQMEDGKIATVYSYVAALKTAGVNITWDELSAWLAAEYPNPISDYTGGYNTGSIRSREIRDNALIRAKSGYENKVGGKVSWMYHYFSNNRIGDKSGILRYDGASTDYWTEPIGWESSVRMIDAKGNIIGPPGVAYIAGQPDLGSSSSTSHPPEISEPTPNNPDISLTVSPRSQKVDEECSEGNMVTINLKANASSDKIDKIWSYFQGTFLSKDPNATMQVKYSLKAQVDKGSPGDTVYYNQFTKGNGSFTPTSGNTFLSSKKLTTKDELTNFLTGSDSALTLQDTNIKVCDKVIMTYIGQMYVCMNGSGKHGDYTATPKGTIVTQGGGASDTAILYTKETPYYYSDMRHLPVSEIKADSPYNESYEAMAGVPTTTNIYLGTGATEYMVNVDLEMKTTAGKRTYTFKVTENNCFGDNTACTYASCPGPVYGGEPPSITHAVHNMSCPYLGSVKADSITDHRNNKHPGVCNYTYTITQNIDAVPYMDITALEMWKLKDFKLAGNNRLQNPSAITLAPNLGYYTYYNQEAYSNGNGRFKFSVNLAGTNNEYWSDTTKNIAAGNVAGVHDKCKQDAANAINAVVGTLSDNTATVISDYVVLETSEGYQNVMYYELKSNNVPLNGMVVAAGDFGNHADMSTSNLSATKTAPNITWPKQPTQDEMWKNNGNAFSRKGDVDRITTTGYNGEYTSVKGKYNNDNDTEHSMICRDAVNKEQPNSDKREGNSDFQGNRNGRYIKTGVNIIDSTTPPPERKWSKEDSIKPVTNGEWDTGDCTVLYSKDIKYKTTSGKNWDMWTTRRDAPYSEDHDKINNIVIHNPISNRDAVVISNDEKYDQRYWGELDPPKLPDIKNQCPNDSSCVFSKLTCTKSNPHTEACYKTLDVGYNCNNKPLNRHVHNSQCSEYSYTPKAYRWRYFSSGCSYSGDYLTISHEGQPTKSDLQANSMYHTSCSSSAYYEFKGQTGNIKFFKTKGSELNAVGKTTGSTYWIDVPFLPVNNYYTIYPDKSSYELWKYTSDNTYHVVERDWDGASPGIGSPTSFKCLSCADSSSSNINPFWAYGHTFIEWVDLNYWTCTNVPNVHDHITACNRYEKVLACSDPHHYVANSQPHDVKNPVNHYPYADLRCYAPCKDDKKHTPPKEINIPGGQPASTTGVFINIDREFKIYYPDIGDFEQQPNLQGVGECSDSKGYGYKNKTDTDKWLRNKFAIYPFNVIDQSNNLWAYGEPIDLLKLPNNNKVYTFECVLSNVEQSACSVLFLSVANNAPESYAYNDATSPTNYDRYTNHGAKMSVVKRQLIDVVGSIGALSIHDSGDPRFAELFKKPLNNGKWLIPNVVKEVDYALPNKIVADDKDARNEDVASTGYNHSVYGITDMPTGGKAHPYIKLPLVPYKNPNPELRKEAMRPGYNLFMDIETVGSYYGENWREDGGDMLIPWERGSDASGMFTYKMQIKPKYWELNLDTGKYNEVDAYMYSGSTYLPIVMTNKNDQTSEYYYYLDWLNESLRRSFSLKEQQINTKAQADMNRPHYKLRMPTSDRDVIGSADKIYLIDLDRTFIGSSFRYGKDMNTGNTIAGTSDNRIESETSYARQSQRWHWTLGLPSSTVFVRAGKQCTDTNIKALQDSNSVIICSLDIKVRGDVWTLEYDGTPVNYSDGGGFKVYPDGKTYLPPNDPKTGNPINDPIVVVYNNKRTSKDDIQTQGTH